MEIPEQSEAIRVLRIPRAAVSELLAQLERDTLPIALGAGSGSTATLCIALQRGAETIGLLTASRTDAPGAFTPQQERIARGIGQLASMALDNARLVEALERADRLKAEFVATMSHELRSPLNVIIGYSSLLLEGTFGALNAEQLGSLERIDKSARELLDLVCATLDLSRLEAGQLPVDEKEIRLRDLLDEIIAETRIAWAKPGVAFVWHIPQRLPSLYTDRLKLKVVIKNLIANALKFTEQGRVTVDVRSEEGAVEISVADTGIGIAPASLSIIFEPFRQVDASPTRAYGGVGLGLYIVRRLLDLLSGTVAVESTVGRGSTFRVRLPAIAASPERANRRA